MSAIVLRDREGATIPLDVGRWRAPADDTERDLVAALPDALLDIGCGPGRMVEAAACAGRRALGIDTSPGAAREASERGVAVLRRSVFDALPGEGRWGAALLLDGNVGIGGDPLRLLRRARELLRPGGVVVVEVEPPGARTHAFDARLEPSVPDTGATDTEAGPWFRWARVGADGIAALLHEAGLVLTVLEAADGRWLAHGTRP